MDAKQKRAVAALALLTMAILTYDIPGFKYWLEAGTQADRVVSNTVDGDLQTVVMDLSKPDPWAMHGWIRQLCYAMLCGVVMLVGDRAGRWIGLMGIAWFLGQAFDAYVAGNVFDDGLWEYATLAGFVLGCYYLMTKKE